MKSGESGGLKSASQLAMEKTAGTVSQDNPGTEQTGDLKTAAQLAMEKTAGMGKKESAEAGKEPGERRYQESDLLTNEEAAATAYEPLAKTGKALAAMEAALEAQRAIGNNESNVRRMERMVGLLRKQFEADRDQFDAQFDPLKGEIAEEGERLLTEEEDTELAHEESKTNLAAKKLAEQYARGESQFPEQSEAGTEPAKKGKIDEGVQAEALDDFRKGLKGEKREKSKFKKTWGWIKERLKGFATLGILEFHQAEKFRSGTGKAAEELSDQAFREADENIERTGGGVDEKSGEDRRLTLEEAMAEAEKIREMGSRENPEGGEKFSKEKYDQYSETVTKEKIAKNDAYIDTLVAGSEEKIKAYLEKYKNEFGESVLTEEKLGKFREQLKNQLTDLRQGLETRNAALQGLGIDQERMKKTMRETLDPNYWRRYVYGGVEAAIDIALLYNAAGYLGSKSVSIAKATITPNVPPVPGVGAGAEQLLNLPDVPMHDNVWTTMKELGAQKMGLTDMTNQELLKVTQAACKSNGIGVDVWNLAGSPMDTMMQQGHPLKISGEVLQAFKEVLMARGI